MCDSSLGNPWQDAYSYYEEIRVMVVSAIEQITAWLPSMLHGHDSLLQLQWMLPINCTVVAQTITDADLLGNIQRAFNNFVQSGQVWAMLIGLVIGYMIRSLTSYG
jgi:hypothetical protein